ncbi:hypothetical protein AB0G15_37735 [Streptosporangium sp. NPDC023825]|uniref:hypothetical protein n=1 Tax=Streptosporangium sp. NPDC023825 TaxID=3154909 RepID=UPI00343D642F
MSVLSGGGSSLEEISRVVGLGSTAATEPAYRKWIRPVLRGGAVAMDRIFGACVNPGAVRARHQPEPVAGISS